MQRRTSKNFTLTNPPIRALIADNQGVSGRCRRLCAQGRPRGQVIDALRRIRQGKRYMSEAVSNMVIGDIAAERGAARDALSQLTHRERDVLRLTAEGNSSAAAAKVLGLSPKTVESYRSRIMRKLEIHNITGLVKFAIRHGITSLDS